MKKYECPECSARYSESEVDDAFLFQCDDCGRWTSLEEIADSSVRDGDGEDDYEQDDEDCDP